MSPEQEEHLVWLLRESARLMETKYRAGDAQHQNSRFPSLPLTKLLDHAIAEAIDQVHYLLTMRRQIDEGHATLPVVARPSDSLFTQDSTPRVK